MKPPSCCKSPDFITFLYAFVSLGFPPSTDVIHYSPTLRGDDRRLLKCQSELNACGLTLGELLKKKAESGVRVLIMIWGETTSIMGTHDTETENYFKGAH